MLVHSVPLGWGLEVLALGATRSSVRGFSQTQPDSRSVGLEPDSPRLPVVSGFSRTRAAQTSRSRGGPGRLLACTALVQNRSPQLLEQVRHGMRARHLRRRTEEAHVAWIRRYIGFTGLRHPRELGATRIAAFHRSPSLTLGDA